MSYDETKWLLTVAIYYFLLPFAIAFQFAQIHALLARCVLIGKVDLGQNINEILQIKVYISVLCEECGM